MSAATSPTQYRFSPANVRRLRKQQELDVTHFAVQIGRSAFQMSAYEVGKVVPPADIVARMATVLGCHPGDLFAPVEVNVA